MFCPWCGKQLEDDAAYCMYCGKDLGDRVQRLSQAMGSANPSRPLASPQAPVPTAAPQTPQAPAPRYASSNYAEPVSPAPERTPQPETSQPLPYPPGERHTIVSPHGKRTEVFFAYSGSAQQAEEAATKVISGRGFKVKSYHDETVWKKGTGLATAMEFVKLSHQSGHLVVQAWIQSGVGNIGLREQPLTGFVGGLPKKMLSGLLDKIEAAVR